MPLKFVRNDITKMDTDAIVNAASSLLSVDGGVGSAVFAAAGQGLIDECRAIGGCPVGEARITGAYDLPCSFVIHTAGPVWRGGFFGEKRKLVSCYRSSLELAKAHGLESVAFPLISSGKNGFPKDIALKLAVDTIGDFLMENDMMVYIVVFDRAAYDIGKRLFTDIRRYIDDNYVRDYPFARGEHELNTGATTVVLPELFEAGRISGESAKAHKQADKDEDGVLFAPCSPLPSGRDHLPSPAAKSAKPSLPKAYAAPPHAAAEVPPDIFTHELDESFQQMLLRKIDEKGMTDSQCYKKANIDRKLFSKIRNDTYYKPKKATAIAFAVALELDMDETEELLRKAGFALSGSNKFDVIIRYFIEHMNYNIFEINEVLFYYDQTLLGAF